VYSNSWQEIGVICVVTIHIPMASVDVLLVVLTINYWTN